MNKAKENGGSRRNEWYIHNRISGRWSTVNRNGRNYKNVTVYDFKQITGVE